MQCFLAVCDFFCIAAQTTIPRQLATGGESTHLHHQQSSPILNTLCCSQHTHTHARTHTRTHARTHAHARTHTHTQHLRVRAAAEKYPDPGAAAAPRRAHHQSLRGAAAGLCWAQLLWVANATVPGIHAGLLPVLIIGMFI